MRVGALFAGYGGLELGIARALRAEPAWFSEIDPAPSRILAHHWPAIPNLGDITAVDWASVPPVDVLAGGFPCQDVSTAGLRRGLHPDTRSGLWSHFALAIDALRPPLVIIENVRGLLSAPAHSDLVPDPWDLGEPERNDRPPLRALGAVLGDLAELGYDAEWTGVRAADAGAPHGRFRVFLLARPTDADPRRWGRLEAARDADHDGPVPRGRDSAPPDALGSGRREGTERGHGAAAPRRYETAAQPPDRRRPGAAPDPDRERHGRGEDPRLVGRLDGDDAGEARERERTRPVPRNRSTPVPPDPRRVSRDEGREGGPSTATSAGPLSDARGRGSWGSYSPAIQRWEHVLGRPAPSPTEAGTRGERLAPAFVEWMMGLPSGHVTDPEIGLTRSQQLKALGNGVVPQQAALALRLLLPRSHSKEPR